MQTQLFVIVALAIIALSTAFPTTIIVEDEEGQQYELTPVLMRQRREAPQGFGAGGGNGKGQSGYAGINNPNGSGGSVGYGHSNGYGHTVSVDGRVPVWSNKGPHGESTINLGGGATQHYGGPGGNQNLDKRVGVNFNHRW